MFGNLRKVGWQIETYYHAEAILRHDLSAAAKELEEILAGISIPIEELVRGGGGETKGTQRTRKALTDIGWKCHTFIIEKIVDGVGRTSVSHKIDHVKKFPKGTAALEIEWNNKDPFFDRDLENFKRLHADGAISIGVIVTRGQSLQNELRQLLERFATDHRIASAEELQSLVNPTRRQLTLYEEASRRLGSFQKGWAHAFVSDKYGEATTHWRKLQDRVKRGVGNPCPLMLVGIPSRVVTFD